MDFTGLDSCGWPQNSNSFVEITSEHDGSSPVTPKPDRIPVAFNLDHGSSDVSHNHDSDSSYSELDSETEAFYSSLNHHLVSPGAMDSHDLAAEKQMSYEELMNKYVQSEEELRTTSLRLQESELEIEKLKGEAEKRDSAVLLAENLLAELETAQREIESRDIAIETEKSRVLEMQRQVVDLETKLSDSSFKFENLVNELEVSRECLDASDAEISTLRAMLCDCQQSFTKLHTDIAGLLANQTFLEDQIWRYDAQKMEMQAELVSRDEHIGALNKELEKQVELQRNVISEAEEEKREAIRQLCFTLDHYKSGYRQLLRFLSGNNNKQQQTIMVV